MYRNTIAFGLDFLGWLMMGTGFLVALMGLVLETSSYPLVQAKVVFGATIIVYAMAMVIVGVVSLGVGKLFETYTNWENNK